MLTLLFEKWRPAMNVAKAWLGFWTLPPKVPAQGVVIQPGAWTENSHLWGISNAGHAGLQDINGLDVRTISDGLYLLSANFQLFSMTSTLTPDPRNVQVPLSTWCCIGKITATYLSHIGIMPCGRSFIVSLPCVYCYAHKAKKEQKYNNVKGKRSRRLSL